MTTIVQTNRTPEQTATIIVLTHKLSALGLAVSFVEPIDVGPIVSVYRFQPSATTRISQIEGVAEDLALMLGAEDVFVKRMPGESAVCVFVPNRERKWVYWKNMCHVPSKSSVREQLRIPLLMGISYLGVGVIEDLTLMPHLLVAGSTGGGKSTWLNAVIATLIYNCSPNDVKFILIDTKQVEFVHFAEAPHMLFETALSVPTAIERFDWIIKEMEARLTTFAKGGHRNILEYNSSSHNSKPYIVVIIDEVADILTDTRKLDPDGKGLSLGKIAKGKLLQIAAKARATGIHVIAATQRPSVKIIDGDIKTNFPARLSFRMSSGTDSSTVLDTYGAEHLLSRGDMLFINPNKSGLQRIHAPLASIEDIKAAVEFSTRR